mgnify:CR=1 FL=1
MWRGRSLKGFFHRLKLESKGFQQVGLETVAERLGSLARSACDLSRRDIVENKVNPTLGAFVHDAVTLLIVDFIHLSDFERIGAAINHKAHPWIAVDGDKDSVSMMKGGVAVMMRFDNAASLQTGRHGSNDRATGRVVVFKDLMHEG